MGVLTLKYLLFIFFIFLVYWIVPNKIRKYVLLLSSFAFISSYGLIEAITVLTYSLVIYILSIYASNKKRLIISLIFTVLPLLLNKYFIPICILLNFDKVDFNISILAISFVCFRGISYLVDTYKGNNRDKRIIDYLLYMFFFPTFLSGPIEKANKFIKEINNDKNLIWNDFIEAILIICHGFIIKLVIADRLSTIINAIYANVELYTKYVIFAIITYPIYIYCDFAGYSYIALGVSKLYGYNVTVNFKQPYFSLSIKEFWNRWHTSLNNWFINYIYIPLGGNRVNEFRKYLNTIIIFVISGVWHGAGLGFIIWGLLNAVFQIIGDKTKIYKGIIWDKIKLNNTLIQKILKIICNYLLISITWIFFSQGFKNALNVISSLLEFRKISIMDFALNVCGEAKSSISEVIIIIVFVFILFVVDLSLICDKRIDNIIVNKNVFIRYVVIMIMIFALVKFGKYGKDYNPDNFIYFDF